MPNDRALNGTGPHPRLLHCPPFCLMKAQTRTANEAWKIRLLCERIFHKSPSFRQRQPRAYGGRAAWLLRTLLKNRCFLASSLLLWASWLPWGRGLVAGGAGNPPSFPRAISKENDLGSLPACQGEDMGSDSPMAWQYGGSLGINLLATRSSPTL